MIKSPEFSFVNFTSLGDDKEPVCDDSLDVLDVINASDLAFQVQLGLDPTLAITSVKLTLSIQSHSGVSLHKKVYTTSLTYLSDERLFIFFITLDDIDISEIIADGECFRFFASIETNLETYSARSNLFRYSPECEHTTLIEYRCDEANALGFYYCTSIYNRVRIPCRVKKPQPKEESNIYVWRNGKRKVLSASMSKEYELETDWMSEAFHDRLAIALMHDTITFDGKLLTKSGSYDIDWDDTNLTSAPAKVKLTENVVHRNSNCGVNTGCSDFGGETEEDIQFIDLFDVWSNGMPSGWTRIQNLGAILSEITGGGIMFSGVTTSYTSWDAIGRELSIPSGSYSVTIELFEPVIYDPFDTLFFSISSLTQSDTKQVKIPADNLTVNFLYTGSISRIKFRFFNRHTKTFVAKVKSVTIQSV